MGKPPPGLNTLPKITQRGFPRGSVVKNPPAGQEMQVRFLGEEDALEKEMASHPRMLAWEIPWVEDSGGIQFIGSQERDTT